MTSCEPQELHVGSVSSLRSIREAIESYRRSQLISSSTGVISYSSRTIRADDPRLPDDDEENLMTPRPSTRIPQETFANDLDWDEDELVISAYPSLQQHEHTCDGNRGEAQSTASRIYTRVDEQSSLLPRVIEEAPQPASLRHSQSCSVPRESTTVGQSTFFQTVSHRFPQASFSSEFIAFDDSNKFFNASALLLGIGMLSEPLAFSYAGWICGTVLIIIYGFITCHTAKYLAGIAISDSSIRTYADIGVKAFGMRSRPLVNFFFCFEVFSVCVVLITLYADSLHEIIPIVSPNTHKLLGLVILIPTLFIPLSLLSYASLLGVMSTVSLIGVVLFDGFSKFDAPGSLWSPAKTSFGFCNVGELGLAFGLFMAGFGAHSALPSLAQDMAEPHRFGKVMNYSFAFATSIYALIGMAGYLMFGNDVNDEISQNLLQVPGYNPMLNELVLWMLVVTSLTKFPLSIRPLNNAFEVLCGLDSYVDDGLKADQKSPVTQVRKLNYSLKPLLVACERITLLSLAVIVSILVPDFGSIMAILGSFSVFILCVIGPIIAKISLDSKATVMDVLILTSSTIMAIWGTGAAFWSTTRLK